MDRSYGESPSMPTPQDPPKWTGAIGEARHADAPRPTKMDRNYGKARHADDSGPTNAVLVQSFSSGKPLLRPGGLGSFSVLFLWSNRFSSIFHFSFDVLHFLGGLPFVLGVCRGCSFAMWSGDC